ncbi:MAG: hypothetical protein Kow0037_31410 [Calditrichia bacterium]
MKIFWPAEFEKFEQRELLGVGQYGLVYKVFNPARDQETVLKLIETSEEAPQAVITRFQREIKSLQKLNSPHIVRMYRYWLEPKFIAFEMEYIPGLTLEKLLKILSQYPVEKKVDVADAIVLQLAKGLAHLHEHRLVHRDLKPSNILLQLPEFPDAEGELLKHLAKGDFVLKITDLVVVKDLTASVSITRSSDFVGTAAYISPEQARSDKIGLAADLYALGVLWYEMLSGRNPFKRKNIYQTIEAHLYHTPPSLNSGSDKIPVEKEHLILTLLQKNPLSRRYTAEDILDFFENRDNFPETHGIDLSLIIEQSKIPSLPELNWEEISRGIRNRQKDTSLFIGVLPAGVSLTSLPQNQLNNGLTFWQVNCFNAPYFSYKLGKAIYSLWKKANPEDSPDIEPNDFLLNSWLSAFSRKHFKEFYQQLCNFQGKVPSYMLLYSLIAFFSKLLKEIGDRQPACLIIENAPEIVEAYGYLLLPLIKETEASGIYWLFLTPRDRVEQMGRLLEEYPTPAYLWTELADSSGEGTSTAGNVPLESEKYENASILPKLISLFPEGCPLELAAEITTNALGADSSLLVQLLRERRLVYRKNNTGKYVLLSSTGNHSVFETLGDLPGEKNSALKKTLLILARQNNFNGYYPAELLRTFLFEPDSAVDSLTTLANLSATTSDYPAIQEIYDWCDRPIFQIKKNATLYYRRLLYRLLNLSQNSQFEQFWPEAEDLEKSLSGKEKRAKQFLNLLCALTAVKENRPEKARIIIQKTKRDYSQLHLLDQYVILAEMAILLRTDNPPYLEQKLSDLLNELNNKGAYWNLPTVTLLLAFFYHLNRQHQNAYKNAALAFTAGQYLNDYWIKKQAVKLILNNPYYENHRDNLVDWHAIGAQLPAFPESIFGKIEFRNLLFHGLLNQ